MNVSAKLINLCAKQLGKARFGLIFFFMLTTLYLG